MNDVWSGIYFATDSWSPSQTTVNIAAGFGDALSYNLTKQARQYGDFDNVNYCSDSYKRSTYAGTALGLANAGRAGFQIYGRLSKAKAWRANSRASRKTRNKKIAEAGNYRNVAADATLTVVGGAGVDSFGKLHRDWKDY